MEKRIVFSQWQKATLEDFNNLGLFPRKSFDTIVGELLIPDLAFAGFAVTQTGPAQVTVGTGHLYYQGKVYVNDQTGGSSLDLSTHLPAATEKIVTIAAYGTEQDSELQARTFLTDADTRATVAREVATQNWRWANVTAVATAPEGPDPTAPTLAANVCPLAYVTLTPAGISSIVRATDFVAPNLRELDDRLNAFDIWKIQIGTRLDTLQSDLLALASRIIGLAKWSFVHAVAADLAKVKDLVRIPENYTAWGADHFLTDAESDTAHADWLALIEEGCRFPAAAIENDQIGLLNPFDDLVINTNSTVLPAWDAIERIINVGHDIEKSISQYQYQTTSFIQKTMSRQVIRYGTPYTICTNSWYWDAQTNQWRPGFVGVVDYTNWTFIRNTGEVYNILSAAEDRPGHQLLRVAKVWTDTVEEPYWDVVVNTHSVSGAMLGQSFANSQDGWLSGIQVFFSRVAAAGDVTMVICECTNGMPDITKMLAMSTVHVADMHTATAANMVETRFEFEPTFLARGRYAFIMITGANHYVWAIQDQNYVAGTMFYSTDGVWFQGDLTQDLAFKAEFCQFRNNQTKVQLQSLQLQNGIAAIEINNRQFVPAGCELTFEVQKNGVWYTLAEANNINSGGGPDVIFIGLPPLLPFRASFTGTKDVQPALGVASNSRVTTWRPRSDFVHISEIRDVGGTVTTITCDIRLEAWRGQPWGSSQNTHTFDVKLMRGAGYNTLTDPTTVSEEVAPDDPVRPGGAVIRHYTWTGVSLTSYKFKLIGHTDNVLTTFHVAERIDVASA